MNSDLKDKALHIIELSEKATPGPWNPSLGSGNIELTALCNDNGEFVCDFVPDWALGFELKRKNDNMDFISEARNSAIEIAAAYLAMQKTLKDIIHAHHNPYVTKNMLAEYARDVLEKFG